MSAAAPRRTRLRLTPRRRHLAAIITIAVSTAFVTVMILAGSLITQIISAGSGDTYRDVDLVATPAGDGPPPSQVEIPGAQDVWPAASTGAYVENAAGDRALTGFELDAPDAVTPLASGTAARTPDEIVLDAQAAKDLSVGVGDTVTVQGLPGAPDRTADVRLKVSGIAEISGTGALSLSTPVAHVTAVNSATVFGPDPSTSAYQWFASVPSGADAERIAQDASTSTLTVTTGQEAAETATRTALGGFAALGMILLVFVAIALLTTAVVISNTFTVTLAQRTRSLALLRTLGATRRQVAAVVLRESLGVGLLGGVIGLVAAHLLAQAGLLLAQSTGAIRGFVPVPVSVWSILVPIVVGVLVTLAAGILPARRATAVTPLEALRPAAPASQARFGLRGILSTAALVLGVLALAGGVTLSMLGHNGPGILLALLGGTVSFLGVLVGLVTVSRPLSRLAGALVSRVGGLPARIATANTTRHPGRSAATIGALLIGTTLMTMMAVGARTAESTLTAELDSRRPIDIVATGPDVSAPLAQDVADVPGVAAAEAVPVQDVSVGASQPMTIYGIDPGHLDQVVNRSDLAPVVRDDRLVLGSERAKDFGLTDGQELKVTGTDGQQVTLTVVVNGTLNMSIATPSTLARIAPGEGTTSGTALLAKLDPRGSAGRENRDAATMVDAIQTELSARGAPEVSLNAAVIEKEVYGQILGVLLVITLILLGVAVVVALVGVANTLSLGVVERTGENALLRALGTTRAQMRAMLGWEGVLLALVGAVLGIALGMVYGVLGILSILGGSFPVSVTIPWEQLAVVLVLAIAAGWGASVLPGRAAARTAPAQALAAAE